MAICRSPFPSPPIPKSRPQSASILLPILLLLASIVDRRRLLLVLHWFIESAGARLARSRLYGVNCTSTALPCHALIPCFPRLLHRRSSPICSSHVSVMLYLLDEAPSSNLLASVVRFVLPLSTMDSDSPAIPLPLPRMLCLLILRHPTCSPTRPMQIL